MNKKVDLLVIVVGLLLVSPLALAKPVCPNDPDLKWPKCEPTGGGSTPRYYNVDIDVPMVGGGTNWRGDRDVNYKGFWDTAYSNASLDLTYFQGAIPDGADCFPDSTNVLTQVILSDTSKGAKAQFWFPGTTTDGIGVLYYLMLYKGTLENESTWPPTVGSKSTMDMKFWKMRVSNEGNTIKQKSCLKEDGDFEEDHVIIEVTGVEPPTP